MLFTSSYETWTKEQQQFFRAAIKASGKGKEVEEIIKSQKLLYRYKNGGSYIDRNGKKVYYPAGSPNWYNNRNGSVNWEPFNGM